MSSSSQVSRGAYVLSRWQKVAALVGVIAIAILFRDTFLYLWSSWQRAEYSHAYIIPPVVLFLLWQRWPLMRQQRFQTSWSGLLVLVAGLASFAWTHETMPVLTSYALLVCIGGTFLAVVGRRAFRIAMAPIALLVLAVPLPLLLSIELSAWLQDTTARIGVAIMRLGGTSVLLEQGVIDLGHMKITIDQEQSGLTFVLSLLTLGAVIAFLIRDRKWIRIVLVCSTLPIAVSMNAARVGVIGIMTDRFGFSLDQELLPLINGWVTFMVCVALLLIEASVLVRNSRLPRRLRDTLQMDFFQHRPPPSIAAADSAVRGRILIVASNFAPELTGIGKYVGEMTSWLSSSGFEIRVITAPPYYPTWRVAEGYTSRQYMVHRERGVLVFRCPLLVPRRPRGLTRLIHMITFALSTFPVILWQSAAWRPHLVFVVEPPLSCAPAAWLGAKLAGARSWLHVQDFEVDAAFELGLLRGAMLQRLAAAVETVLMRRFDWVSTISPRMLRKLLRKGVERANIRFFPNWVDTTAIRPIDRNNALRADLGISLETKVLLYSGNMGEKQGLDLLIAVASRLANNVPDALFLLCGDGAAKRRIMDEADGMENVRFIPLQPLSRLNELLALADVHLLPQRRGAEDLVMPSKLTAILASGRPVVASARRESDLGRAASAGGVVVPPGDADAFANALRHLLGDEPRCAQLSAAGRAYAMAHWDRDTILQALAVELDAVALSASAVSQTADA